MTPLDGIDCAATAIQLNFGLAIIRRPDADVLVVRATCEKLATRVPLNLFDHLLVALPGLDRALRLVDVPQVDELASACDGDIFIVLPL